MDSSLPRILDGFSRQKVLVIGEAMLDSYLEGNSEKLCREAPVPVVNLSRRKDSPGGAANTAVNLACLGAKVTFLSVIGDDAEGVRLRQALESCGVSIAHLLVAAERQTLAKHRVIAGSQILVRYDQGSTAMLDADSENALISRLNGLFVENDAVIISDYNYGIFTPRVIQTLAGLQAKTPRIIVADSRNLAQYRNVGVTAVKPNYDEVTHLLGVRKFEGGERADEMLLHGERVLEITGAQIAAVTLDTEGALIFERDNAPYRTYAKPTANSQATGAGDTYVSALTLALASGADTPAAAELASAAAAIVVSKTGTASCSLTELRGHFIHDTKYAPSVASLAARIEFYRWQGKKIVFTNGCFDILHRGHVTYLSRAKALGDVLIVGINTDDSIRRVKGRNRPINTLEDRAQVLAALSCVDHIVAFAEDLPDELIRAIRPDIFVKGGDYSRATLPEASLVEELGGTVRILPYLPERSTTNIIERIVQVYGWRKKKPA